MFVADKALTPLIAISTTGEPAIASVKVAVITREVPALTAVFGE